HSSSYVFFLFLFTSLSTTASLPLSLHDALPICMSRLPRLCARPPGSKSASGGPGSPPWHSRRPEPPASRMRSPGSARRGCGATRSEEHTSELQSLAYLVCRLLLEKKKKTYKS